MCLKIVGLSTDEKSQMLVCVHAFTTFNII